MARAAAVAAVLLVSAACDPGAEQELTPPPAAPPEAAAHLPTPFTAEQIRDEWVEGLTLLLRLRRPDADEWQRWTVVAADRDGVGIEMQPVDADGQPFGEPTVQRSSWAELRDHALFPADRARREPALHDSALGTHDGWLYVVDDPEGGTVTEYFFATELPGAPVWMETSRDGALVFELTQQERRRPPRGRG